MKREYLSFDGLVKWAQFSGNEEVCPPRFITTEAAKGVLEDIGIYVDLGTLRQLVMRGELTPAKVGKNLIWEGKDIDEAAGVVTLRSERRAHLRWVKWLWTFGIDADAYADAHMAYVQAHMPDREEAYRVKWYEIPTGAELVLTGREPGDNENVPHYPSFRLVKRESAPSSTVPAPAAKPAKTTPARKVAPKKPTAKATKKPARKGKK
jgi:hypothetical protein